MRSNLIMILFLHPKYQYLLPKMNTLYMRLLITANSGAGKSFLAKRLSKDLDIPMYSIDDIIFRVENGEWIKRSDEEVEKGVSKLKKKRNYIVEGTRGAILEELAKNATHLIYLNPPWEICKKSILKRESKTKQQKESLTRFIENAETYYTRDIDRPASMKRHMKLFDNFTKSKYYITSRKDADCLCI